MLFAVGRGGDPSRHRALLEALHARGCDVVAPHADMLATTRPTADELLERARRLRAALDEVTRGRAIPVAGVGHSIGAATLLALAGGALWLGPTARVPIEHETRLDRLVLLAPATGFFAAPGALDGVRAAILAFAGDRDTITPPATIARLGDAVPPSASFVMRVVPEADHFSFMNTLPPHVPDTMRGREAFLASLEEEIARFVLA